MMVGTFAASSVRWEGGMVGGLKGWAVGCCVRGARVYSWEGKWVVEGKDVELVVWEGS